MLFILSLTLSDLAEGCTAMPVSATVCSGATPNVRNMLRYLPRINELGFVWFGLNSIHSLCWATVCKMVAITKPLRYEQLFTRTRCYLIILGIWVSGALYAAALSPWIVSWDLDACIYYLPIETLPTYAVVFLLIGFAFGLVAPIALIVYANVRIFVVIVRTHRRIAAQTNSIGGHVPFVANIPSLTSSASNMTCKCPSGYSGRWCEVAVYTSCLSRPCQNGAACSDGPFSYTCRCGAGFTGTNCGTSASLACASSPCSTSATCDLTSTGGFVCRCAQGHAGLLCRSYVGVCGSYPCVNGATCRDVRRGFHCACRGEFVGTRCENRLDSCVSSPCDASATCLNQVGGYLCACRHGYGGRHCLTMVDVCVSRPCLNAGTCRHVSNAYQCDCRRAYEGVHCERLVDPCAGSPCLRGGRCIVTNVTRKGFVCHCKTGFHGEVCELFVTRSQLLRARQRCGNLGTPIQHGAHVTRCLCQPGITGATCDVIEPEHCQGGGCLNGGTCVRRSNSSYACACTRGYGGVTCARQDDDCRSDPCPAGETCTDLVAGYSCVTALSTAIQYNTIRYDTIRYDTIRYDTIRYDTIRYDTIRYDTIRYVTIRYDTIRYDTIRYDTIRYDTIRYDTIRYDTLRYDTIRYDTIRYDTIRYDTIRYDTIRYDTIRYDTIRYGTHTTAGGVIRCICPLGFTGSTCEQAIGGAKCDSDTCLNGGTCQSDLNVTTCVCPPFYTGERCHLDNDPCVGDPCPEPEVCQLDTSNHLIGYRCVSRIEPPETVPPTDRPVEAASSFVRLVVTTLILGLSDAYTWAPDSVVAWLKAQKEMHDHAMQYHMNTS
ncbi:hypothetical protein NP493_1199g01024 [Ridgeia piscesae]|uniref:Uncharacterized protein n=1 Tax=Ridgeia piscesae TaxID=27915 RepID=A0AAD9NGB9_RIDPI|nr:hypothetical protein NP493_1199g01024 [Ridgeia piscesae]